MMVKDTNKIDLTYNNTRSRKVWTSYGIGNALLPFMKKLDQVTI